MSDVDVDGNVIITVNYNYNENKGTDATFGNFTIDGFRTSV